MKISFVITDKLFEKSVWIIADGFSYGELLPSIKRF